MRARRRISRDQLGFCELLIAATHQARLWVDELAPTYEAIQSRRTTLDGLDRPLNNDRSMPST
jgi:hypothetical protein